MIPPPKKTNPLGQHRTISELFCCFFLFPVSQLHDAFDDPSANMQLAFVAIPPHFNEPSAVWPDSLYGAHPDCYKPYMYNMVRWTQLDEARKQYEADHSIRFHRTLQMRLDISVVRPLDLSLWMKRNTVYWFLRDMEDEALPFFKRDYDCCFFGEPHVMELGAMNSWWTYLECPQSKEDFHPNPVGTSLAAIRDAPKGFQKECVDAQHCFPVLPGEAGGLQPAVAWAKLGVVDEQINKWALNVWRANITVAIQPLGWTLYVRPTDPAWAGRTKDGAWAT
eukprot:c10385_g1_i2.p1 GENE.c10385_g1_i2~~c10385_g1_i2.p1  ORF type:complete len:279 (+),score=44.11 c10385_g1_i2:354-1190(+)